MKYLIAFIGMALSGVVAANPKPVPETPGNAFHPPTITIAAGGPLVFEHSQDAGPDETFLLIGDQLTTTLLVWGGSAENPAGQEWKCKAQFLTNGLLAATLPERAADGPFLVWAKNGTGYSAPIVLNQPVLWWCHPAKAAVGQTVRLFGRNLARRPDFVRGHVYIAAAGHPGVWARVIRSGKYELQFEVPESLAAGDYQVWVHAGNGGEWGWSEPLKITVTEADTKSLQSVKSLGSASVQLKAGVKSSEVQAAMDTLSTRGGGTVQLPPGNVPFSGTLRIPAGVTLQGAGREATTLQLVMDPSVHFARLSGPGWGTAPGAVHTAGDTIEYDLDIPKTGNWTVWVRYATDMSPWKLPGVSGHMSLQADNAAPVLLQNLENTGGFGAFRWTNSATHALTAGHHKLTWKNVKGGGVSLDAYVFALDPAYVPTMSPPPTNSSTVVVLQGEDCTRFTSKDGALPGGERAAVWLCGDHAGVRDLSIAGNAQVNLGIAVRSLDPLVWLQGIRIERVRVADCEGKQGENCGVYFRKASDSRVCDNELWGRAPLFISGARTTEFARNRLVSVTRFGGNAEAAILGRNETIEECLIEGNVVASPSAALSGGPTARRLIWLSTGHGSITHNWLARNGVEPALGPGATVGTGQARFGGVAGTDQNVGEMILFEANHRTMFFGSLADADAQGVLLPKIVPPTPDNRLGNVKRDQLAHDTAGNETPFWPPDADDGSEEPPISEYYVTIFSGQGQGQTRRVIRRVGERLVLEKPWRVPPRAGCIVAVGTGYYRNHIMNNYTPDGMTGIQLWISCVENVIAGNTIARQRKPGFYLYANGTTLASSMPRTWNRGISPLFWNVTEGNRTEECSAGALVTSGDAPNLPVEFPRALGNVLRHNSFIRNRTDGVILTAKKTMEVAGDRAVSVAGTIVEFNVVRDAQTGYHAANGSDYTVFRRNHAYFWYPVSTGTNAPVAFQTDVTNAVVVLEKNTIEGIHGVKDGSSIDWKRADGTTQRLPEK